MLKIVTKIEEMTMYNTTYKKDGNMRRTTKFTDIQCVAALNSCIDLEKYNKLPGNVQSRIESLLCHHRIKMVCFFSTVGFGLRVHREEISMDFSGDEASPKTEGDSAQLVDVNGYWVRCPKELWNKKGQVDYLVLNEDGTKYFYEEEDTSTQDEGEEFDMRRLRPDETRGELVTYQTADTTDTTDSEDDPEKETYRVHPIWTRNRIRALKVKKEKAEVIAKRFKGVVVKA